MGIVVSAWEALKRIHIYLELNWHVHFTLDYRTEFIHHIPIGGKNICTTI